MRTEGATSIWWILAVAAWVETSGVFAQQALRAPAASETDLVTAGRFTRTFGVNPNAFLAELDGSGDLDVSVATKNIQERVRDFFTSAGIGFTEDNGSRFFFNDRTGILTVEGTIAQLEAVDKAIQVLTGKPAHVAIEMRLMETTSDIGRTRLKMLLPQSEPDNFALPSALPIQSSESSGPALRTAVLTQQEFTSLLKSAEQSEGIDLLSAPRTVTINGRRARIAFEDSSETMIDPPMHAGQRIKLNAE